MINKKQVISRMKIIKFFAIEKCLYKSIGNEFLLLLYLKIIYRRVWSGVFLCEEYK